MKKLLLIPVVILLLTGCNKPAETQNVEQPETQQVVTPEQQPEESMEENTEILYNEDGSIDTSNWKTYTNEEYGYKIKFPGKKDLISNSREELFSELNIKEVGNISMSFHDENPAWWENSDREYPTKIEKISSSGANHNINLYKTYPIAINKDEVVGSPSNIIIASMQVDEIYLKIEVTGNNIKYMKELCEIMLNSFETLKNNE